MTKLGKYLTLLNVAIALTLFAWSTGLYTNQIFWHTPQNQEGQRVDGLVAQVDKKLKELQPMREAAERRYYASSGEVSQLEQARPKLVKDYEDRIRSMKQGDVADIQPPVQQLVYQGANLDFKRSGQPAFTIDGEPALAKATYRKMIQDKIKELADAKAQVAALIAEEEKLTVQINGTKDRAQAFTDTEKGLRVLSEDWKKLVKEYALEQQYLRSPLTTYSLDNSTLRRRQQSLQARLEELSGGGRAVGQLPKQGSE